jgi:hypothetical protein
MISEITQITNYFPTVNPVHRVHTRGTEAGRAVHRGHTVARTEGMVARSPELGLRPLRCTKARWRGRKRGRGAWGARLGPHQSSGGAVATRRRRYRIRRQRRSERGLLMRGEREKGSGRGAVKLGEGAHLLYGAWGAPGRGGRGG